MIVCLHTRLFIAPKLICTCHGEYFKHGITNVACIASNTNDDDDEDEDDEDENEVMMTTCGVWEKRITGKLQSSFMLTCYI